jgi:hypothetical protein
MKKTLALLFCAVLMSSSAFADNGKKKFIDKDHDQQANDQRGNQGDDDQGNGPSNFARPGGLGNLVDHGGQVLTNAKVVYIFWGWASNTTDPYVSEVISFRASGMINHIGMLSQYRSTGSTGFVGTQPDVFASVPPSSTKVTDAMVQQKVASSCAALPGGCKTDTIYEVFIPSGYYSDDGTGATSCGGPNLQYCAYHGNGDGVNLSAAIKYSIQPYPSCSGCHGKASWTAYNDQEHFIVHETRESMTDAQLNAWYDRAGYEADDKCAWGGSTLAFLFDETVGGHTYAYQMEYSNSARNCVK